MTNSKRLILLIAPLMFACAAADDSSFTFSVMDRFRVSNDDYDLVITGQVKSGTVVAGSYACVQKANGETLPVHIVAISKTGKLAEVAETGELVGLATTGVEQEQVDVGDSVVQGCQPG